MLMLPLRPLDLRAGMDFSAYQVGYTIQLSYKNASEKKRFVSITKIYTVFERASLICKPTFMMHK